MPPNVVVVDYSTVPRSKKRKRRTEQERELNRKRWHQLHVVELNSTKRLLFKALRLLRRNGVELPTEMAAVLSQHEATVATRVERRRQALHELEASTP